MSTTTQTSTAVQVHRVYIKAPAKAVWDAIIDPEWTRKYGYGALSHFDLRPGGKFRAVWPEEVQREHNLDELVGDGEVVEVDAPHRLVQTWRLVMDPATAAEGFTRLTYEIKEISDGVSRLTVTHELEGAPTVARLVSGAQEDTGAGGGWDWVLSDLKSVLETGSSFIH
jgi:uncharacterized protein YndB with AHSA1/START domain